MATKQVAFVLIKPDARQNVGTILSMFEEHGFSIIASHTGYLSGSDVLALYKDHIGKPFFVNHAQFMMSDLVTAVLLVSDLYGADTWKKVKSICGATNPSEAAQGTVRQVFGTDLPRNAIHASDTAMHAVADTKILFSGMPFTKNDFSDGDAYQFTVDA